MKKLISLTIVCLLFGTAATVFGAGGQGRMAVRNAYFDKATGHKYFRNTDNTYSEYSKKGVFLKSGIPSTSALLVSGKHITPMGNDTYLVYHRYMNNTNDLQILPSNAPHPEGWRSESILYSGKALNQQETGLAYTKSSGSYRLVAKRIIAVGPAYFDTATGHKYLRNQDNTYTEFSRRGKVLKTSVPNTLPLLVSGRNIIELNKDSYLVYEKGFSSKTEQQVLPSWEKHPDNWQCKDVLFTADNVSGMKGNPIGYTRTN
ncbi:MAG: hypothetical protein D3926_13730 [Desulfobacteraceae bacterium]|nr:MAG: hypothetical protein D3926_13730 [Desulfobacteraceae bacterium]